MLTPQGEGANLHIVTGEEAYRTPILDDAPWANRYDPATDQFYGFYPTSVTGIGDSTYGAASTESVEDGGTIQGGRNATRDVKVSGLIVAGTEMGAEAGLTWLRSALSGGDCDDQCGGGYLRYFLTDPAVCPVAWGAESGVKNTASFGSLDAGQRVVYRWTKTDLDSSMPARVRWTTGSSEGIQVEYGALNTAGEVIWSARARPLRVNYAPNPTFRTGLGSWTFATRGIGGALVGSAIVGTSVVAASAPTSAVIGSAVIGSAVIGSDAPTGLAEWWSNGGINDGGQMVIAPGALPGTVAVDAVSDAMASPPGTVTVSLALSGPGSLARLQLVDAASGLLVAETQTVVDQWTRVDISGVTNGTVLHIIADGEVHVDQVLCEFSDTVSPYFDGRTVTADYTTSWLGSPDASASVQQLIEPMEFTADDSDFRPFFAVLDGHASNIRLTWWMRTPISVAEQLRPIDRSLHNVAVTQGPQIVQRIDGSGQGLGYLIQVEFLFAAGNPFSYSPPQEITTVPLLTGAYSDPVHAPVLADGWLYDPLALIPSSPPAAPSIIAAAIDPSITAWQRYYITIPADTVADWASSVPILALNTHDQPVRQIRVRFHPNPFGYAPQRVDPSAWCADFVVSYLPSGTQLLLNGITQTASATKAGVAGVPADSILYGSNGGPMTWPHLSCGIGYVLTLDVPSSDDYDLFDVSLQLLREE